MTTQRDPRTGDGQDITSDHEGLVRAFTTNALGKAALKGEAYAAGTPGFTIPIDSTAPEDAKMLYIKNTGNKSIIISQQQQSWNGGGTTKDNALEIDFFIEPPNAVVTGNNIQSAAVITNLGLQGNVPLDVQIWDGSTGTGMIITNGATLGSPTFHKQGFTVLDAKDATIIPPGRAISVALRSSVADGRGTIGFFMYLKSETLYQTNV